MKRHCRWAQADLATANEDLARLETGPNALQLQQLQAAVAQADSEQTQTDLAGLEAGPDLLQVQQLDRTSRGVRPN